MKDPGVEHVSFSGAGADFRERSVRVTKLQEEENDKSLGPMQRHAMEKHQEGCKVLHPLGHLTISSGLVRCTLCKFCEEGNVSVIHSTLGFQDLKSEQSPACESASEWGFPAR